jgi:thiamine transporter
MDRQRLLIMLEISLLAGIALVLSYLKIGFFWAYGGSISLVMVPVFIMAYRRGWKAGVVCGLLIGLLKILTGATIVHPIQLLLDYPLPYAGLGLAGLFAFRSFVSRGRQVLAVTAGIVVGSAVRFLGHFVSGVVWFGEYAPEGVPVVLYSFGYNISYLLPEMLISMAVILLLLRYRPQFFGMRISAQ